MLHRIKTHEELLKALQLLKPKFQRALLKSCDEAEINCICECIYNVLKGKIPLQDKALKKLHKHKNTLRTLISKGKNKKNRKKIIVQKGGAFLPIIIGSVLSALLGSLVK